MENRFNGFIGHADAVKKPLERFAERARQRDAELKLAENEKLITSHVNISAS